MTTQHAALWLDHHEARIFALDAEPPTLQRVHEHAHPTHQHHSEVRTVHEFFDSVCDALNDTAQVLVLGSKTAVADFRHYVEKHRAKLSRHVAQYDTVGRLSDAQIVAHAHKAFVKIDRMGGVPTPT
jgi:stalled ribosome rescue protein Dom34